jgi:hypothetical protein
MGRTRNHVVVLHRWRDGYAEYANYLDHGRYAVSYVSTEVGRASVPLDAAAVTTVAHIDDLTEVRAAVVSHVTRFGEPTGIVALKEDDLLTAARLREDWSCPGPSYDEQLLFRDKYLTYAAVVRAGLAAPAYAAVSTGDDVRAFGAAHGWPVVVKPRCSSSSEGVTVLPDPDATRSLVIADGRPWLAQVFDDRQIYHVDGVFTAGRLGPWKVSRYLSTCLEFRSGQVLGSVEEDAPEVVSTIGAFAAEVLGTLTTAPVVFHLEVFMSEGRCALLEVAARAGGAEIAFLWREVHGIDLMRAAFDIQLGRAPRESSTEDSGDVAGWLLVPAPDVRPCRITEVTSMTGVDGPYAEVIPRRGDVVSAADSYYEHVGGRFRFRGGTTREVESAIVRTAGAYRVSGVSTLAVGAGS